jgi:hypothetical protein
MRLAVTLSALLLLAAPAARAQGLLERSRREPAKAPAADDGPDRCASEDDESALGELFGPVAAVVLGAPFTVPHALLGDDLDRSASFPGHPYARPEGGFLDTALRREPEAPGPWYDPAALKPWSARAQLENGNNFSGLNRTGAALVFDTGSRFGLSSRWDHFQERLGCGCRDHTTLGDVHLTYRFAQSARAAFHAGAGARWRFDHRDRSGGVSFLYGADFFPVKPLVVSASVELGNLDRNFVVRARASAGWQIGRCELLGGYDFLRLGSVNLQGPFLGVRLSF